MQFRKRLRVLLLLVMVLVLLAGNAFAAGFYLKMDGIEGESKDPEHVGWIELLSFKHGPVGDEMKYTFKHIVDIATPSIQAACMNETTIPTCTIELYENVQGERQSIYQIVMTDVTVNSAIINIEDLGEDRLFVETVELIAKNSTWKYRSDGGDIPLPKTGDESPLLLWILLATGSITVLLLIRKRNMQQ